MKTTLKLLILAVLWLSAVVSQAQDKSLALQLTEQNVQLTQESGRSQMIVDIAAELRKQHGASVGSGDLEIKMITVDAKSRLGGSQIMLQVQRGGQPRFVDMKRVETDPELFESAEGFQKVELVNFERGLKGARLVIMNPLRLRNLQVTLGRGEDLKVLGTYGGFEAAKVAGARTSTPSVSLPAPTGSVVQAPVQPPLDIRPIVPTPRPTDIERRELPPIETPRVVQPVIEPRVEVPVVREEPRRVEPKPEPKPEVRRETPKPVRCIQQLCVGQAVYHRRTYWEGVIISVDVRRNLLNVRFGGDVESFEAPVAPRDLARQ